MTDPDLHTRDLAAAHDDPTAWFEQLYEQAADGAAEVPWDRPDPSAALVEWVGGRALAGVRTLVVGCGYGRDAEFLARQGADVVAFDIAPTAIEGARARHVGSSVEYVVADALAPRPDWFGGFDLVVENMTVQALPEPVRSRVAGALTGFVAPGGTLLVVAAARDDDDPVPDGPPWPLVRAEVEAFAGRGLETVTIEELADETQRFVARWRAEFRRPA